MVFSIFPVDLTTPRRILPRIDTFPTKGHFLSTYRPSLARLGILKPSPTSLTNREPLRLPRESRRHLCWTMVGCLL